MMAETNNRTDIRIWGAIVQRGPREFGVIVTAVAADSETVVGVTDFRRVSGTSMEEAQAHREALIQEVQQDVAARGDRVLSLERLEWQLTPSPV
jgi:hypothetical protein